MSVHKSLVVKSALMRHRNVLRREERIEIMQQKGLWKDGDSSFGLPKTRVAKKLKKAKKKKKEE